MKKAQLTLDVKELSQEQLDSIRALAEELYGTQQEDDIFKATISAVFSWIRSSGHRDFKYHLDLEIVNKNTPITWIDRSMNV